MLIKELYEKYKSESSDINEHLETLCNLVKWLDHITEMWVREWLSTIALLHWLKKWWRLVSFDINWNPNIEKISTMAKDEWKKWNFRCENVLNLDIEYTDFLFIDTWHCYDQLIQELTKHSPRVKKYIVMHDTTTFWEVWENDYIKREWWYLGLNKAIDEFLEANDEWTKKKVYTNNNWLTILERCPKPVLAKPNKFTKIKSNKWEVIVYTAICWNHDVLKKQPKQDIPTRFICFTDWPVKIEVWAKREIVTMDIFKHLSPRMKAKYFRTNPDELFEWNWTIMYMDGSGELIDQESVSYFTKQLNKDILCFKHPERNCIYKEAEYCYNNWNTIPKYIWQPMIEQCQYYLDRWHPKERGLSATWLLIYSLENKKVIEFLHDWRTECLAWSYQDQLSFDYLVRRNWIKRQRLSDFQWENKYINFLHPHLHNL